MAKKKAPPVDDYDYSNAGSKTVPEVEGLSFCWRHLEDSSRSGWGIWTPVMKSTDLGEKAVKFYEENHMAHHYLQAQEDSDYIFNGPDAVLGWATRERVDGLRAHNTKLADDALKMVMREHGTTGRLRYVSSVRNDEDM